MIMWRNAGNGLRLIRIRGDRHSYIRVRSTVTVRSSSPSPITSSDSETARAVSGSVKHQAPRSGATSHRDIRALYAPSVGLAHMRVTPLPRASS